MWQLTTNKLLIPLSVLSCSHQGRLHYLRLLLTIFYTQMKVWRSIKWWSSLEFFLFYILLITSKEYKQGKLEEEWDILGLTTWLRVENVIEYYNTAVLGFLQKKIKISKIWKRNRVCFHGNQYGTLFNDLQNPWTPSCIWST